MPEFFRIIFFSSICGTQLGYFVIFWDIYDDKCRITYNVTIRMIFIMYTFIEDSYNNVPGSTDYLDLLESVRSKNRIWGVEYNSEIN